MGIFSILSRNSAQGSRTRGPEEQVPFPAGFRGVLRHDSARCTGCKTCAYVCSPTAITFNEADERFTEWTYFAGQCTFCGRCVEYCPTRSLDFEESTPLVTPDPSAHRVTHRVDHQPCARCGRFIIPLPLPTLQALYGDPLPEDLVAHQRLCERCRGKAIAQRLKSMLGAGTNE
jgi:ferredoxin